jgi:hypothetical protein
MMLSEKEPMPETSKTSEYEIPKNIQDIINEVKMKRNYAYSTANN